MIWRGVRRLLGFPVYTEAELLAQTNADDLSTIVTRRGDIERYELPTQGQFLTELVGRARRIDAAKLKAEGRQ